MPDPPRIARLPPPAAPPDISTSITEKPSPSPSSSKSKDNIKITSTEALAENKVNGAISAGGLSKLDVITSTWSTHSLWVAWAGVLLLGAAISFDQETVYSYQTYATSTFSAATLLGTIGTVQNVVYAVAKPPIAKVADVFGRFEAFAAGVVLVSVGFILLAASQNIATYAAAQIFFVVGQITLQFMIQIFAADSSNLQNRAIFNALPYLPFIVTCWVGGYIVEAIIKHSTWRWGYGMYAIMLPAGSLPLLGTLLWHQRRARSLVHAETLRKNPWAVLRQLDLLGLLILSAALSLLLLPITLAAAAPGSWNTPHIIAMLAVGGVCLAAFPAWENWGAAQPMLSFALLQDRTILGAVLVAFFEYVAFYIYQPYFYTYLVVARGLGPRAATNVGVIYTFTVTVVQFAVGFAVKYYGRYKWIVMFGVAVKVLAGGLMLRYRTANSTMPQLVISQVLLGGGMGFVNTVQVAVQAACSPADMAAVTALLFAIESFGGAVGDAISGGIWTNLLPRYLAHNLPSTSTVSTTTATTTTTAANITSIANSVTVAQGFAWGSPERDAVNRSYDQVMRVMLIINVVVLCIPLACGLLMRDINLVREDGARNYGGVIFGVSGSGEAAMRRLRGGKKKEVKTREV